MHRCNKILTFVLCSLLLLGCRGDEVIYPTIGTHVTDEVRAGGLYVLCEGNMGSNKARLDYINLEDGEYYSNWYGAQNPTQLKELGDVGNDLVAYGNRLYALAFHGDKMYVSAYVGSVADADLLGSVFEVDTASLEITREVKVGHQPDELVVVDDKLYVVNSGGYLINRYDSTMSVIDLHSFTELRKVVVGLNPTRLRLDDQKHLWVCCQGNYNQTAPQVVVLQNEAVLQRILTPCSNISIQGTTAYVIDNEQNTLNTISTIDFALSAFNFQQTPSFENPYGLLATADALYITDAKNYVSSGVLHCFSYDGHEHWSAKTGDIPGHLCRVTGAYDIHGDTVPEPQKKSPYIKQVYEYLPAMGQFVNELPKYEEGDDAERMCRKCEQAIANNAGGMISLGGWGGYVTFGFDHAVENKAGKDIQILGNAFYMAGSTEYGSSEPGIVLVSRDENGNGWPDDTWYELKGCLYDDPQTQHHVSRTYTRESDTVQNTFHQHPYYPQWIKTDEYTLTGALLPPQSVVISGQNIQRILDFGYVDNKPNSDIEGTSFDISWAVDESGRAVTLDSIHFVRVYNAVDETLPQTGELSTEVAGAIDLHCNK